MAATARLLQPSPDGVLLLDNLRDEIEALFGRIGLLPAHAVPAAVRQLLLMLELRLKLEEQLLFPALGEAVRQQRSAFKAEEDELHTLRDLADRVRDCASDIQRQRVAVVMLEGVGLLHFAAVDGVLSRHAGRLDRQALGEQVRAMLQRWQQELQRTGDIEDEERDPVGLPPR